MNPSEVLYFGCLGGVGHYLHSKSAPRDTKWNATPWGSGIDGGCFPEGAKYGVLYTAKKGGWTAICVQDHSVDTRGGSHSTFVIPADISTDELLKLAREQWPEVFARRGFPSFTIAP